MSAEIFHSIGRRTVVEHVPQVGRVELPLGKKGTIVCTSLGGAPEIMVWRYDSNPLPVEPDSSCRLLGVVPPSGMLVVPVTQRQRVTIHHT